MSETKTYSYNELDDSAKSTAYLKWAESREYFDHDENVDSLNEFCETFNIKNVKFEYGGRDYISADIPDTYDLLTSEHGYYIESYIPEDYELSGIRLAKWIANKFDWTMYQAKEYRKGAKVRKSRVQKVFNDMPTGWHMDYPLWECLKKFLDSPTDQTYQEVMTDCLHAWLFSCRDDYEGSSSQEYFEQECAYLDKKFDEEGNEIYD